MSISCIFQTNDPSLEAIWEKGIQLFAEIDMNHMESFTKHTADLAVYVELALILTADIAGVENLLYQMADYLEKHTPESLWGYPDALLRFASYVDRPEAVKPLLERATTLIEIGEQKSISSSVVQAHRLGAKLALQKVSYLCDMPLMRAELGMEISQFQSLVYQGKKGIYEPFEVNYLTAAYGFLCDDGEDTIREYLMERSFEVEKWDRHFLYTALYHLEAFDALLSSILEAGAPSEGGTPAELAGLLAMLTMVCGIDVPMLANGIHAMQPHLPHHMAFRAVMTSPDGPIYFDLGELMFHEFDF